MKQKCDGDMTDWFCKGSRRAHKWRAGQAKYTKKRANKRLRKLWKKELKDD